MKPHQNKSGRSSPMVALALFAVVAGGGWLALRGDEAPVAEGQPAVAVAQSPAQPKAEPALAASPRAEPARALPARQFAVGESFVYQIDSTRRVSVSQGSQSPAARQ